MGEARAPTWAVGVDPGRPYGQSGSTPIAHMGKCVRPRAPIGKVGSKSESEWEKESESVSELVRVRGESGEM